MGVNMNMSAEAIFDYFLIDEIIKETELEALNPFIDKEKGNYSETQTGIVNAQESKNINYAYQMQKVDVVKERVSKVREVIDYLPGIEKEVISLLYCCSDRQKKKYKDVSYITGIDYKFIKNTDVKVRILVGQKLFY